MEQSRGVGATTDVAESWYFYNAAIKNMEYLQAIC